MRQLHHGRVPGRKYLKGFGRLQRPIFCENRARREKKPYFDYNPLTEYKNWGNMFSMGDIVDLAIQIETNAERVYRSALKKESDPILVSILGWLADEEVEHAKWFRRLKQTIPAEINDPAVEAMGKSLLSDVLGRQSFSLKEANFGEISELGNLLLLAIEFEKDKVIFYKMLRSFIEDRATMDFLEKIIKEETHHIEELSKLAHRYGAAGKNPS